LESIVCFEGSGSLGNVREGNGVREIPGLAHYVTFWEEDF
jgi:hypothetical protein